MWLYFLGSFAKKVNLHGADVNFFNSFILPQIIMLSSLKNRLVVSVNCKKFKDLHSLL